MSLKNKVALVTGGAKGIGLATAAIFVREGAKVVVLDLDVAAGNEAAGQLGSNCVFFETDVSKSAEVSNAVQRSVSHFGAIDFLINNAGIIRYANAETCCEEEWDEVMNINLKSAFLCSKYAIPHIRKRGGGVIIHVASAQSYISSPNMVHYTTAKSALLGLTRSMAIDFAPSVRVIAVCPGTIDTPMARDAWSASVDPDLVHRESINMHPLKRIGKPEEIGEMIVFLCSDKSSFITGQAIRVDGGLGIEVPGSVNEAGKTPEPYNNQ